LCNEFQVLLINFQEQFGLKLLESFVVDFDKRLKLLLDSQLAFFEHQLLRRQFPSFANQRGQLSFNCFELCLVDLRQIGLGGLLNWDLLELRLLLGQNLQVPSVRFHLLVNVAEGVLQGSDV
jgi:hypothetical protein